MAGQSLVDISVQETGTIANAFAIAQANAIIGITTELSAGMEIAIPDGLPVVKLAKDYYDKNNIVPGTAADNEEDAEIPTLIF